MGDLLERREHAIMRIGRRDRDVAQRHHLLLADLELLRIDGRDLGAPSETLVGRRVAGDEDIARDADIVIGEISEQRRRPGPVGVLRRRADMATAAFGLAVEEHEPFELQRGQLRAPHHEIIEFRVEFGEGPGALEGGDRPRHRAIDGLDLLRRERSVDLQLVDRPEQLAVIRIRLQPVDDGGLARHRHLDAIEKGLAGLIGERRRASIPELAADIELLVRIPMEGRAKGGISGARRVEAAEAPRNRTVGHRRAVLDIVGVDEARRWKPLSRLRIAGRGELMAAGAGLISPQRQVLVGKEPFAELDFERAGRVRGRRRDGAFLQIGQESGACGVELGRARRLARRRRRRSENDDRQSGRRQCRNPPSTLSLLLHRNPPVFR
ncbi:hypothetical protein A8B73_14535 [Methylosinus sp. 3S-1]|nr:hypothetical protein A8B73_14535 [Methylosinus sp. 3S-1]